MSEHDRIYNKRDDLGTQVSDIWRDRAPVTGSIANRLRAWLWNYQNKVQHWLGISRYYYVTYHVDGYGPIGKGFATTCASADVVLFQDGLRHDFMKAMPGEPVPAITVIFWQKIGPQAYFELKHRQNKPRTKAADLTPSRPGDPYPHLPCPIHGKEPCRCYEAQAAQ